MDTASKKRALFSKRSIPARSVVEAQGRCSGRRSIGRLWAALTGIAATCAVWAVPAAAEPLAVVVDVDPSLPIDPSKLCADLETDLGVPVRGGKAGGGPSLVVRSGPEGTISILFLPPGSEAKARTLGAPTDRRLLGDTVELAASTLLRDEAGEILTKLQKPPRDTGVYQLPVARAEPASVPPATCGGPSVWAGADLVPYVGTSLYDAKRARHLSFNLLAGYTRGVDGVELGGGVNIASHHMCGAQITGVGSISLGRVDGVQLSPLNYAGGNVTGTQIGVGAVADGDVVGLQLAVVDIAKGAVSGAQIGTVNIASNQLQGLQNGVTNLALDNVDGAQVGVVNIAFGKVRGTQVGVFNYAEESNASVGLVTIVKKGRTEPEAWASESGIVMAGVRHGGGFLHNIYGIGEHIGATATPTMAFGLGGRVQLSPATHLDIDVIDYFTTRSDDVLGSMQATIGHRFVGWFGAYAGASYNVRAADTGQERIKPPWGAKHLGNIDKTELAGWPGVTAGVRLLL